MPSVGPVKTALDPDGGDATAIRIGPDVTAGAAEARKAANHVC